MKNIVENQDIKTDKPLPMSYEALKAERDALEAKCKNLEKQISHINTQSLEAALKMAETIKELTDRVNALAVENAALKSRSIKLFNLGYLHGHESTVEGYFVDVHRSDIDTYHDDVVAEIIEDEDETPATDAALAAIQAQGVENAAVKMQESGAQTFGDCYIALVQYANELREAK